MTAIEEALMPAAEETVDVPRPPTGPDLSVLAEPLLAYRYGTEPGADGHLGPGTWMVVDATGTHRANVVVQGAEVVARRYTMTDLHGHVLMALRRPPGLTRDVALFDADGLEIGRYQPAPRGGIQFVAGGRVWGGPSTAAGSGTPVVEPSGKPVARVYGHAPSAPLNVIGTWPAIDPGWAWYLIDKGLRVTDPMRAFVVGLPCLSHWLLGTGGVLTPGPAT